MGPQSQTIPRLSKLLEAIPCDTVERQKTLFITCILNLAVHGHVVYEDDIVVPLKHSLRDFGRSMYERSDFSCPITQFGITSYFPVTSLDRIPLTL